MVRQLDSEVIVVAWFELHVLVLDRPRVGWNVAEQLDPKLLVVGFDLAVRPRALGAVHLRFSVDCDLCRPWLGSRYKLWFNPDIQAFQPLLDQNDQSHLNVVSCLSIKLVCNYIAETRRVHYQG